MGIALKMTLVK